MLFRRTSLVAFLVIGTALAAPASAAGEAWYRAIWHDVAAWFGAATDGCIPTDIDDCGVQPPQ